MNGDPLFTPNFIEIRLALPSEPAEGLLVALQKGFMVRTTTGVSVAEFLVNQCGITPEYIATTVSTIFLDGKPVDDPFTAAISDGTTLALSGAMPGLVGAAMRSGGALRILRCGITYQIVGDARREQGTITVKLFNRIMRDLGMVFLKTGILMRPSDLPDFFSYMDLSYWKKAIALVDGQYYNIDQLQRGAIPGGGNMLRLSVMTQA